MATTRPYTTAYEAQQLQQTSTQPQQNVFLPKRVDTSTGKTGGGWYTPSQASVTPSYTPTNTSYTPVPSQAPVQTNTQNTGSSFYLGQDAGQKQYTTVSNTNREPVYTNTYFGNLAPDVNTSFARLGQNQEKLTTGGWGYADNTEKLAREILASSGGYGTGNQAWEQLKAQNPNAVKNAWAWWINDPTQRVASGTQVTEGATAPVTPSPAPMTVPTGVNLPAVQPLMPPQAPNMLNWYDTNQAISDRAALDAQRLKDVAVRIGIPADSIMNMDNPEDIKKLIDIYTQQTDLQKRATELEYAKNMQRIGETRSSLEQTLGQDREWNFANANIMANQTAQNALTRETEMLNNSVKQQELALEQKKRDFDNQMVNASASTRSAAAEQINAMEQKLYQDKTRLYQAQVDARDQAMKLAQIEQDRQNQAFNQQMQIRQLQQQESQALTRDLQTRVDTIQNLAGMGYDIGYDPNEYIFKGVLKELPEGQTIKLGNYSVTSTSKPDWKTITDEQGRNMLVNTASYDPQSGQFSQVVNAGVSTQYFKDSGGKYVASGGASQEAINIAGMISKGQGNIDDFIKGTSIEAQRLRNEVISIMAEQGGTQVQKDLLQNGLSVINDMIQKEDWTQFGISAMLGGKLLPSYGDMQQRASQISSILAKDNLGLLKGAMSDKDLAFIQAMSGGVDSTSNMSEGYAKERMMAIKDKLVKRLQDMGVDTGAEGGQTQSYQEAYNSIKPQADQLGWDDAMIQKFLESKGIRNFNQTENVSKLPGRPSNFVAQAGTSNNNPSGLKATDKKINLLSSIMKPGVDFFLGSKPTDSTGGSYFAFKNIDTAIKAYAHIFKNNLSNMSVASALGNWVGTSEAPKYAKTVLNFYKDITGKSLDPNTKIAQLTDTELQELLKSQMKKENIKVYNKIYS